MIDIKKNTNNSSTFKVQVEKWNKPNAAATLAAVVAVVPVIVVVSKGKQVEFF